MKNQILKLLEAEGLSPAKFADEIGVQRSSVSHILSGRNKPSYDFIIKVISRFSGINTEWLLTGNGSMIKSMIYAEKPEEIEETLFNNKNDIYTNIESVNSSSEISKNTETKIEHNVRKEKEIDDSDKSIKMKFTNVNNIDYILVFYKDGTFKQYNRRE